MTAYLHPFPHCSGVPTLAEVEITSACNASCAFCPRELFDPQLFMSSRTFDLVLERLRQADITRIKLVGFGEPTLHPELIGMLERCRAYGLSPALNTNGTRLDKWGPRRLLERCDEIIISLHSMKPERYRQITGLDACTGVLASIAHLRRLNAEYGRAITIYFVITALNQDELEDLRRFSAGVNLVVSGCTNRTIPNLAVGLRDEGLSRAFNAYPRYSRSSPICGYAEAAVAIDASGRYLRCTNDVRRDSQLGTVGDRSVTEAFQELRQRFAARAFDACCRTCDNYQD